MNWQLKCPHCDYECEFYDSIIEARAPVITLECQNEKCGKPFKVAIDRTISVYVLES